MASPVEQNKRHIQVLGELISDHKLTPTRLGFHIPPKFHNWVLVPPQCSLPKQRGDEATILKMDLFDRGLEEHNNRLSDMFILAKVCAPETVHEFARQLVSFHQPITFDYAAKFGITETQRYAPDVVSKKPAAPVDQPTCDQCRAPVETKVVNFCRAHGERFGGKILCRTCQVAVVSRPSVPVVTSEVAGPSCQECRVPVDAKVVAFCRINSRRFNKRVLCRKCQINAVITVG